MRSLNALILMVSLASPAALAQSRGVEHKAAVHNVVRDSLASGFLFQGQFAADTDEREFFVTLKQAGSIVARTLSYAGGSSLSNGTIPRGGFDPTLTLFDSTGRLVAANEDGGCGPGGTDTVTGECWDSYLSLALPAGIYRLVLTQSTNTANGPTLADSFKSFCSAANQTAGNCAQNFTPNPKPGVLPDGFWDETRDRRGPAYTVEVLGAPGTTTAVEPLINSSATLPGGVVGQMYPGFTFTALPIGTYQWSFASGTQPPGLSLDPNTGALTGTPTVAGTYTFLIQANDGVEPLQQTVTLAATNPNVLSVTAFLPSGVVGQAYGPVIAIATGGTGAYTWTAANLPPGLSISSTGVISGLPLVAGTTSGIVITVHDAGSSQNASSIAMTVTILPSAPAALTISSAGTSGEIVLGTSVSTTFSATGGTAPYFWTSSGLPAGLTLNPNTGIVTGMPTQPGVYSFTVTVADAQNNTANDLFGLRVFGLSTSAALPNGTVNTPYSQTLGVTGGFAPYHFSGANLPPGLSFSGSTLSGTPTAPGPYSFAVQIGDSNGFTVTATIALTITGSPTTLTVAGGVLASGAVTQLYSQSLSATGGTSPYIWSIVSGALPPPLTLSALGVLSGTPTASGAFTFTAGVTDSAGGTASGSFTIFIASMPLTISGLPFPNAVQNADYPLQLLTGSGGTPPYTFSLTGNLPPGLVFQNGELSGTPLASGNYAISITLTDSTAPSLTTTAPVQLVVNPPGPDLILSTASVSFALTTSASGLPAPQNVTVRSSDVSQLLHYSAVPTPAVPWLKVAAMGTTTPDSITFALDPSALTLAASATPLATSIVVTCIAPSPCAGKTQTIRASLAVSSPPPQLSFTSSLIEFSTTASNTKTLSLPVGLENTGAGSAQITSATAADGWLTISGVPASIAGGPPVLLTLTANPAGLGAGFFRTTVTANSPSGSVTLAVTLSIAQTATLELSTKGAQYPSNVGSSPGNNQGSFQLSAIGGALAWTASVDAGGPWLSLNPGPAAGTASPGNPSTVSYTIDRAAAALLNPAGSYYGTIQIAAAGASNSPQSFQVVLEIAPASALPLPDPQPAGLIFTSIPGGSAPAAQTVTVYSSAATSVPYSAAAGTVSGGAWLSVSPTLGNSAVTGQGASTISVNPGTLSPGVYRGGVNYQLSAAVRTVDVTLVIEAAATTSALQSSSEAARAAPVCTAKQLLPIETGLVNNFSQATGIATPLSIRLFDDCGNAVAQGQVVARFSNGDAPLELKLVETSSGLYSGTWTPGVASSQVTITATATASGYPAATSQITGMVTPSGVPYIAPGGAVHIYNSLLGGAVAPGTILAIYGSNFAGATATDSGAPLPSTLGATSVTIGGIPAPLYYVSPNQIDAQMPLELSPGKEYEVIVTNGGAHSTPSSLQLIAAAPGIAALANGQVIAQHSDYSLVTGTSPAKPGEFLIIYLAGMGATDVPLASGTASPLSPLAHPTIAPVLTLNGSSVPIYFTGLAPGFVGLYQMNFQVPASTGGGNVQLVVSQSGVASNLTILPVQR